jgi:hypothetical protein
MLPPMTQPEPRPPGDISPADPVSAGEEHPRAARENCSEAASGGAAGRHLPRAKRAPASVWAAQASASHGRSSSRSYSMCESPSTTGGGSDSVPGPDPRPTERRAGALQCANTVGPSACNPPAYANTEAGERSHCPCDTTVSRLRDCSRDLVSYAHILDIGTLGLKTVRYAHVLMGLT